MSDFLTYLLGLLIRSVFLYLPIGLLIVFFVRLFRYRKLWRKVQTAPDSVDCAKLRKYKHSLIILGIVTGLTITVITTVWGLLMIGLSHM